MWISLLTGWLQVLDLVHRPLNLTQVKLTKKAYREYLNKIDAESRNPVSWKHHQYGQRKRLAGDYLYAQDRILFDLNYAEWIKENS